jgi:lipopolysaccharide biosynthesis glycosyltransferase
MASKRKVVVISGNWRMYEHMTGVIHSLLHYNPSIDKIYLLIEDEKFPYKLPEQVEVRQAGPQPYFSPNNPNALTRWTYFVLLRAAYTKIFPDEDLVLSIDTDTIVEGDITPLWRMSMKDYYLAGCLEPHMCTEDKPYMNCGVMLMNLKKIREDGMDDVAIGMLNKQRYQCCEETVFNEIFQGHIKFIPSKYNASRFTEPTDTVLIRHYTSDRNWHRRPEVAKWRVLELAEEN